MGVRQEIELEAGTVRMREDGILQTVIAANAIVTVERAKDMFVAAQKLCDVPRPVLTDIRLTRGTDVLTVRYTVGSEVSAVVTRHALLVASPVSRMIGSVFLGLSRPPYRTRLFTDEETAIAWLLEGSGEAE